MLNAYNFPQRTLAPPQLNYDYEDDYYPFASFVDRGQESKMPVFDNSDSALSCSPLPPTNMDPTESSDVSKSTYAPSPWLTGHVEADANYQHHDCAFFE